MYRDLEDNYEKVIEDQVTNGRGYNAHMYPGFKLGRESTFLVQLTLGYAELDILDGALRSQSADRRRVRQDVGDLTKAMKEMDQNGLTGFYIRLKTPEDVLNALRDYQRNSVKRGFHG